MSLVTGGIAQGQNLPPVSGGSEWGAIQRPSPDSKLYLLETLNGNVRFYANASTLTKDDQGVITFSMVSYSPEQRQNGGYSLSGPNTLNCRNGSYQASYGRKEVDRNGDVTSDNGVSLGADMTLRYDGKPLYGRMKNLCVQYSGLPRDEIRW